MVNKQLDKNPRFCGKNFEEVTAEGALVLTYFRDSEDRHTNSRLKCKIRAGRDKRVCSLHKAQVGTGHYLTR